MANLQALTADASEELAESIREIYAETGSPTEEERDWARQALGIESKR